MTEIACPPSTWQHHSVPRCGGLTFVKCWHLQSLAKEFGERWGRTEIIKELKWDLLPCAADDSHGWRMAILNRMQSQKSVSSIKSWHCKLSCKSFNSGSELNNIFITLKALQKSLLHFPMLSLHSTSNLCSSEQKVSNCLKITLYTTSWCHSRSTWDIHKYIKPKWQLNRHHAQYSCEN